jgi:conjugative transposon TraJ protein
MKKYSVYIIILLAFIILPGVLYSQTPSGIQELRKVLEDVKNDLVPRSYQLTDVARAIGAFGALWYIGYRVFKHIANAEPIDFFPLFKPFVLALLIGFYPVVLNVMDAILKPMVISTDALVKGSNEAVNRLIVLRAYSITHGKDWEGLTGGLGYNDEKDLYKYQDSPPEDEPLTVGKAIAFSYSIYANVMGFILKGVISGILQVLYYAAALCIDAMRTFHLVILSLLGPFVLCLCMFDGFQHTLSIWLARYINIYLWLPIANLFGYLIGRIQQGMLKIDIDQSANGDLLGFGPTDIAYLVFLLIAVLGYFSIPSIANYVIHASGANALLSKTTGIIRSGGSMAMGAFTGGAAGVAGAAGAAGASGAGSMSADKPGNDYKFSNMADAANSEPYLRDPSSSYQHNQISGGPRN